MALMATKTNRITVNFSEDAAAWLNAQAEAHNINTADFLRRLVDETRGAFVLPAPRRRKR